MRPFLHMKIKKKLLLIYFSVCCVAVFLLLFVLRVSIANQLFEHEKDTLGNSLQQSINQVERQIDSIHGLSNVIYNNSDLLDAFNVDYQDRYFDMYTAYSNEILTDLYTYTSLMTNVNYIKIYTSCGITPYRTCTDNLQELREQPFFPQVEDSLLTEWVRYESSGQPCVAAVRKLPQNSSYPFENYLFIDVKYADLFSSLTTISHDEYGLTVVDENGTEVYCVHSFSSEESVLTRETLLERTANGACDRDGEYLYLSAPVQSTGWTVYYYGTVDRIQRSIDDTIVSIFLFIAVIFLLLSLLTFFLVRTIFSPIAQLTSVLEKTILGNLGEHEIPVDPERRDEVGTLIRTYNAMQKRIRNLIDEAYVQKLKTKEYQLNALRAQINPHFLYNTLSLISAKAIISEQTEISELVQLLTVFYRTALNSGQEMTSIRGELDNIRAYLSIQLALTDHSFSVAYNLDESLLDYPLPCFVLQPLVENAIDHGLRDSRNPDKRLEISLFRRVDCYCIAIRDNGLGIEPERMENLFCLETGHIGVKNVYERLKLFYGTEDVLRIDSVLQQYTLVTIKIPIRPEENRNASPGAAPEKGKESSL